MATKDIKTEKKPAVFFDRDGVICEHRPYLHKISDFKLRPGVGEGIQSLSRSGYSIFLVTNQPMVAMGLITIEELERLHEHMNNELAQFGAKFDKIYYCPHSPTARESKHPNLSFIKDCNCRKPLIGMYKFACQDFNIDSSNSFMIGDSWRDHLFAETAGIQFLGVKEGDGFIEPKSKTNYTPKHLFQGPKEAIGFILKK